MGGGGGDPICILPAPGKAGTDSRCGLEMPTVPSIPSRVGQRGSGLSMSAARSEHEVSEIIDGLSEQEVRRHWGPCWTHAARAIVGVGVSRSCLAPPDPPLSALTEFMEPAQLHLLSLCAQGPGEYVRRLPPTPAPTQWHEVGAAGSPSWSPGAAAPDRRETVGVCPRPAAHPQGSVCLSVQLQPQTDPALF